MTHTLKNRRNSRKINERLHRADKQVIKENRRAQLLLETMDEKDLQKASDIIDKLRKVKGKGVKSLDSAIQSAETQLNKYTGSGPLTKAWSNLKSVVGFDNPLVKFMTFANALETGFKQMPTILHNITDIDLKANADKTLSQIVTDPEQREALSKNMLKALTPGGFFGAFKKIPYVDKEILVQDLLNVPIKNFAAVLQQINTGPNTQQVAGDLKDTATAKGETETRAGEPGEPTKQTSGPTGSEPTAQTKQSSGTTPTGEKPDRPENVAASVYKELSAQLLDAAGSEQRARAILKVLADEEKLKK